jgi:hypothetical protein
VTVTAVLSEDLDWIVSVLAERRAQLVKYAPVFWRPAPTADQQHRSFINYLLTDGDAKAYRTDRSVLVAAPRRGGWLIDDAHVPDGRWLSGQGRELWDAFAADCTGADARFVCPTYEHQRAEFAATTGLHLAESWWLIELEGSEGEAGVAVPLPGADAVTVAAPPVYSPPGPILFLPLVHDAARAVPAAIDRAPALGCSAVVVNQIADDDVLAGNLADAGLRRHCDYFVGTVSPI